MSTKVITRICAVAVIAAVASGCGGTRVSQVTQTVVSTAVTTTTVPSVTTPADIGTTTAATVPSTPTATAGTVTTPTATVPTVATTSATPVRPPHLRPGSRTVAPTVYSNDVFTSLAALRRFSDTLTSLNSPSEFRARLTSLRGDLRRFDAVIRRLRTYQLANPRLDRQRSALAAQGPGLARAMSDLLDAVRDGNRSEAQRLASDVQRRLAAFRAAA